MKKFVLTLDLADEREKRKALKTVAALPGIDEICMDMMGKKMTVIGTVDPVSVVSKLRKFWQTASIVSVGPAKVEPPPEKKEEPKKEEAKKEEAKKEEGKKEEAPKEEAKKEEGKKEEAPKEEGKKEEGGGKKEGEKKPELVVAQPQAHPHPMLLPPPLQQHPMMGMVMPPYRPPPYYPPINTYGGPYYYQHQPQPQNAYYVHPSMDENPNSCVIC